MRLRASLLWIFASFLLLAPIAFGEVSRISDVEYNFDQVKVNASADSFHFLRSFVDYYYRLIVQNSNSLNVLKKSGTFSGWCVGDAHAENFGILLKGNGSTIFTMNDMDDSGPCPVVLDLLRMMVSSRLYMPSIDTPEIVKAYLDGLKGKNVDLPDSIKSLNKDALKLGFEIESKDLQDKLFKRKASMSEVDTSTKQQIAQLLEGQYLSEAFKVQDIVAMKKIGGGSGGLQRYEVLISNNKKQFIHLEFKELVTPAIASVATEVIPDQLSRMKRSLQINQGDGYSHYYNVFKLQEKFMLLRPKFAGNLTIALADSSDHDNKEIINYEAYILGRIHANTVNVKDYTKALEAISSENWEEDISDMTEVFNKRFVLVKNPK